MKIHEYQAKSVLAQFGVAVPRGEVATTPDEAEAIAKKYGGTVVVKSQIHAGGRGKGTFKNPAGEPVMHPSGEKLLGGVVVVPDAGTAKEVASRMLGNTLVTIQSGAEGKEVGKVLIEEGMDIEKEFYLAILLDRAVEAPVFIASAEGGTEIEVVAAERPDAILKVAVDPRAGYSAWIGRKLAFGLGLGKEQVRPFTKLTAALYEAFMKTDASLVEINPLVVLKDGRVIALDAKVNFDDNALYRYPHLRELRDLTEEDPLEVEAGKYGLNYIKLDGNVGCMVNGAGLAMGTMDIIKHHGGSPANFLDVGGGATTEAVTAAFKLILSDDHVKAVLVNIFGGIMRCDVVAEGVVAASKTVGVKIPVVVRLEGTNVEKGQQILKESGLNFIVADGMKDAAEKVVAAAGGA
ncbi:MAG: ADP-forming succinate--CoA ligase subunit beta [Acidobacteria bacterium]|uniref:Succinate--CoA ligase [ADP-forming] subunit beta n=1 Tax=Candidatus Polarisedimenticola svalbardensis TaxID=2886004 RepID=A0A8J6Y7A1_9BACT|nr:ADP-forming succinate--CoA ligase subunit beta [Candidatus Polarisedimenticola svalbardensis]